ncbi:MAG: hypothetical protein ACRDH9_12085 [Actinomycetota bacterium]
MRRVRPLVALAAAGLLLLPGQASAAPTVSISGVTVTGGSGSVTGTAAFEAISAAQSVVGDETTFNAGPVGGTAVADAAGLRLTGATILPLANNAGLRFTWLLDSLPPEVPPEGVRYTWGFRIGTRTYQIQVKRTNIGSATTTEDPVGHIQQLATTQAWFQLRGACVTAYPTSPSPVAGCFHLAFLQGAIDIAGKKITVDMPFETKDKIGRLVAPDFKPGAVLTHTDAADAGTAGMTVAASFQAAVSNTQVSRYINSTVPYYVAPQVSLGVAAAAAEPSTVAYGAPATLSASGFSGTVTGLSASKNTVFARACNGTECTYTSFKAL